MSRRTPPIFSNGANLPLYTGKLVCVFGTVSNISNDGLTCKVVATDNTVVTVKLREPINQSLNNSVVEVEGVVGERSTITADKLRQYNNGKDGINEFNTQNHKIYCDLVTKSKYYA